MAGPKIPETPQMKTGGFPGAGGRLPVSPPELPFIPGPPQTAEELQARVGGWEQFLTQLTQPGFESTLFNVGTSMLMDKQPGQSSLDHGVSSVRNAVAAQNIMKEQARQRSKEDKKEGREDKRVSLEERRVDNEGRRLDEDSKHREKMLDLENKKLAATIKHYDQQAAKLAREGMLSPSDALQIAQESVKVRIDSMKAQLELMDTEDPNYQEFMNNYNRLRADAPMLIQQESARYMQTYGGMPAPAATALPFEEAASRIRGDQRYSANPEKGEAWLQQNYPGEYQTPMQPAATLEQTPAPSAAQPKAKAVPQDTRAPTTAPPEVQQELQSVQAALAALGEAVKTQGMTPEIQQQIQALSARQNVLLNELRR